MPVGHDSDCSLHNGPASFPNRCDCFASKVDNKSWSFAYRLAHSPLLALRREYELGRARIFYLCEKSANLRVGATVAMPAIIRSRLYRPQRHEALQVFVSCRKLLAIELWPRLLGKFWHHAWLIPRLRWFARLPISHKFRLWFRPFSTPPRKPSGCEFKIGLSEADDT
jgi:hypothetical protein